MKKKLKGRKTITMEQKFFKKRKSKEKKKEGKEEIERKRYQPKRMWKRNRKKK